MNRLVLVVLAGVLPGAATLTVGASVLPAADPGPAPNVVPSVLAPASERPTGPTASTRAKAPRSCADLVAKMSVTERVGQVLMVAQSSTRPSASGRTLLEDLHVGSVVLLGNSRAGTSATRRLTDGLRAGAGTNDGVRLLVAVDQEGGLVQRLQGSGFTRIPSARTQAGWSDASLQQKATTWSRQLGRAGVDANLAPVADVVPSAIGSKNAPIGALGRGYGSKPSTVAHKTAAVVRGMHAGGTATAAKHFPGLGRVRGNTDFTAEVVDRTTTRHDALLAGFTADVRAGTDMVMISSAVYRKIDARRPAAYSPVVMRSMLRGDLGFTGVIVSDDLFAKALSSTSAGQRGVRFLSAGGDLALVGDPAKLRVVRDGLLAKARADRTFDRQVTASATRVVEMKSRQGLASCAGTR